MKNRTYKRKKIHKIITMVVIFSVFAAMTITVGAVNNWDYIAFFSRESRQLVNDLFNENELIDESFNGDVNFRVVNNAFDGITFELSAVYADNESLLIFVDAFSEELIFTEKHHSKAGMISGSLSLIPDSNNLNSTEQQQIFFPLNDFEFNIINEQHLLIIAFYAHIPDFNDDFGETGLFMKAVEESWEFSLYIGSHNARRNGLPLPGGKADLRFTIDAADVNNSIEQFPDLQIDNNVVIHRIRVTPFYFIVYYDGHSDYILNRQANNIHQAEDNGWLVNISFKMKNGDIRILDFLYDPYHSNGSLRSITHDFASDSTHKQIYGTFQYDKLLDIDEMTAIIINDVEIPVKR